MDLLGEHSLHMLLDGVQENIDLGGYFTRFRPNCVAVMRALVPNNGSQYTETRDQGLTFKQNTVPGQTLKSFNDLDDAYWTLLGKSSACLCYICCMCCAPGTIASLF